MLRLCSLPTYDMVSDSDDWLSRSLKLVIGYLLYFIDN